MPSLTDSVSALLNVPQRKPHNFGDLPLSAATNGVKDYENGEPGETKPDADCGDFYVLNHLASRIQAHYHPDEPLPEWAKKVVERYRDVVVAQSRRMFSYVLLITTREARHQHAASSTYKNGHAKLFGKDSEELLNWQVGIHGEGGASNKLKAEPPSVTLGTYLRHLSYAFHKGGWTHGYGGKAWGAVTDCLLRCVEGQYSLEVFVDLGYALAHNGGPIFNKGMLYQMYTNKFQAALDLQRAGMLPALFLATTKLPANVANVKKELDPKNTLGPLVKEVQEHIGGLPIAVDYEKVYKFAPDKNKHEWSSFLSEAQVKKLDGEASSSDSDDEDDDEDEQESSPAFMTPAQQVSQAAHKLKDPNKIAAKPKTLTTADGPVVKKIHTLYTVTSTPRTAKDA